MGKIFLLLLLSFFPFLGIAQLVDRPELRFSKDRQKVVSGSMDPFKVTVENSAFEYLSGGTVVSDLSADEGTASQLPIGFQFLFGMDNYYEFYVTSNGILSFKGDDENTFFDAREPELPNSNIAFLAPFWQDLDGSEGTFSYKTEGVSPNRVLIAQWANFEHYSSGKYITFQVRLYEGSNKIEYHYKLEGKSFTFNGAIGLYNGVSHFTPTGNQVWLKDTSGTVGTPGTLPTLKSPPETDTKYTFTEGQAHDVVCQGQMYFNAGGGSVDANGHSNDDGLYFTISGAGNWQIVRGDGQLFYNETTIENGTTEPYNTQVGFNGNAAFQGLVFSIGKDYYTGGEVKAQSMTDKGRLEVVSSTCQSLIGLHPGLMGIEGIGKQQRAELKLRATKGGKPYDLIVKYGYQYPAVQVDLTYEVVIPEGNTEVVRLSHGWDTYLSGGDRGPGFINDDGTIMGVFKSPSYEAFQYLGGTKWSGYYSAHYETNEGSKLPNNTYPNLIDTKPETDNGIGISMDFGTLPGTHSSENRMIMECKAGEDAPELIGGNGKINACKEYEIDLNKFVKGIDKLDPEVEVLWRDSKNIVLVDKDGKRTSILPKGVSGTYTAVFYADKYKCESGAVTVTVTLDGECDVCYKPGNKTPGTRAAAGITTLDRKDNTWMEGKTDGALFLESKEKGFIITRTTDSAITTPVEGMLIFDTATNCLKLYNGTTWNCLEQTCVEF